MGLGVLSSKVSTCQQTMGVTGEGPLTLDAGGRRPAAQMSLFCVCSGWGGSGAAPSEE